MLSPYSSHSDQIAAASFRLRDRDYCSISDDLTCLRLFSFSERWVVGAFRCRQHQLFPATIVVYTPREARSANIAVPFDGKSTVKGREGSHMQDSKS